MKIIKAFYGVDKPRTQRLIIVTLIYLLLILFVIGMYSDFTPSDKWWEVNLHASISITALIMLPLYYMMYLLRENQLSKYTKGKQFLAICVFPIVIWGFIWVSFIHGLPSIYTKFFGLPHQQVFEVTKQIGTTGRSGCRYRLYSPAIRHAFPKYLCISSGEYKQLPKKSTRNTYGKISFFGYYIEKY